MNRTILIITALSLAILANGAFADKDETNGTNDAKGTEAHESGKPDKGAEDSGESSGPKDPGGPSSSPDPEPETSDPEPETPSGPAEPETPSSNTSDRDRSEGECPHDFENRWGKCVADRPATIGDTGITSAPAGESR